MHKKIIIIMSVILSILIFFTIYLLDEKKDFRKPTFDKTSIIVKNNTKYLKDLVAIDDNYQFYLKKQPKLEKNKLNVDFYSNSSEDIYLKLRLFKNDKVIGESGLIKRNELIKNIKLSNKINVNDEITMLVMSYEKDTYYSYGEVKIKVKVGK